MTIKITDKKTDKVYCLEFTRSTIRTMENQGFDINEISSKPANSYPHLFRGAFMANHSQIKRATVDELFDKTKDKQTLINKLMEMYGETLSSLTEDADDIEGNVEWEVSR